MHFHTNPLKKITCWSSLKDEELSHSHFIEGWDESPLKPKANSKQQKTWNKREWYYSHCYLDISVSPNKVYSDKNYKKLRG